MESYADYAKRDDKALRIAVISGAVILKVIAITCAALIPIAYGIGFKQGETSGRLDGELALVKAQRQWVQKEILRVREETTRMTEETARIAERIKRYK